MGKILTISIAAYNVEKYIRHTLDSLLDDRIIDDLEIFVVDDGGIDKTLEIAQEYAERYPKSIFPIHKENGGYGSTINTSIELATGKYFKQLDGDDWYNTENLVGLIGVMRKVTVDCVLTDYIKYSEITDKSSYKNIYSYIKEGEYKIDQAEIKDRLSMYTSAFSTRILKNLPSRLSEHSYYTDIEYSALPIPYINSVYIYHKAIYVYRLGAEGQSMNITGITKHYQEHETVFWKLLDVYNEIPIEKKGNRKIFQCLLVHRIIEYYRFLCLLPENNFARENLCRFTEKLKEKCPELLDMAKKDSRLVRGLVGSRFLAYPFLSIWTKLRWEQDGRK